MITFVSDNENGRKVQLLTNSVSIPNQYILITNQLIIKTMAILSNGILGGFSGKIGNVVGGS